jgi:hypothetical protein
LVLVAGSLTLGVPPEFIADYLAGALLTLVHWWLDHGSPYKLGADEGVFPTVVMSGVRTLLRQQE